MRYFLTIGVAGFMLACGRQPKIDYQNKVDTVSKADDRIKDTTKVLVAALPGKFDSTETS